MILRSVIRINLSPSKKNSTYPSQAGAIELLLIWNYLFFSFRYLQGYSLSESSAKFIAKKKKRTAFRRSIFLPCKEECPGISFRKCVMSSILKLRLISSHTSGNPQACRKNALRVRLCWLASAGRSRPETPPTGLA